MKGIWKYRDSISLPEHFEPLSLGEGNTPLVRSRNIGPALGMDHLYFKLETANPTGSYKDRFASVAISQVLAEKGSLCLATSSGNTGAALAAYSAMAGIPCQIAIVDGAPEGKLKQMRAYGAALWMIKGFGTDSRITEKTFEKLSYIARNRNTNIQVSAFKYCPVGMLGVATISYEIAEALEYPDHVFVPAGGGGLCLAIARGFFSWKKKYKDYPLPKVNCVQPQGNDTIAGNLRKGLEKAKAIAKSRTKISGLQVANVIDGNETLKACAALKGLGILVSDKSVYQCQRLLATQEGIYAEPAGAVAMAGLKWSLENGEIAPHEKAVCIITGNGFKDTPSTDEIIKNNPVRYLDSIQSLERFIG